VQRDGERFVIATEAGPFAAERVVLATGGLSVPQTGSDGAGYGFARGLGHDIVPTTPALVPLLLGVGFHDKVAGVSHPAEVIVSVGGRSSPDGRLAPLDARRRERPGRARCVAALAPRAARRDAAVRSAEPAPGLDFEQVEATCSTRAGAPAGGGRTIVSEWLPASVAGGCSSSVPRSTRGRRWPTSPATRDARSRTRSSRCRST
jgi:hypothetical protein